MEAHECTIKLLNIQMAFPKVVSLSRYTSPVGSDQRSKQLLLVFKLEISISNICLKPSPRIDVFSRFRDQTKSILEMLFRGSA